MHRPVVCAAAGEGVSRRRFGVVAAGLLVGAMAPAGRATERVPLDAERRAAQQRRLDSERQAQRRADLCSNSTPGGSGLRGEHFARPDFGGAKLADRIQASMDLLPGMPAQSVRWSGWLRAPVAGLYRLHANVPGVRVRLAQQQVLGPGAGEAVAVEMAGGRFHPIVIDLARVEPGLDALLLEWTVPYGARFAVPGRALYPPSERAGA